jgi:hypothetical protein
MIKDYDIEGAELTFEEPVVTVPVPKKKKPSKARKLIAVGVLAVLLLAGAVMLTPSLRKQLLSQPKLRAKPHPAAGSAAATPADTAPLPEVPVAWYRLDFGSMPGDIGEDLELGKYYYDRRLPGNFGLAIYYWKQALARHERKDLKVLVGSAELELARQFSGDSVDAYVLLKQGNRSEAVLLLDRMRADYLDITAPQYVWTSLMLRRFRPRR